MIKEKEGGICDRKEEGGMVREKSREGEVRRERGGEGDVWVLRAIRILDMWVV